jgi:GTPase
MSSYADYILSKKACPIFCCSSLTGEGINQIRQFISLLNPRPQSISNIKEEDADKVEFLIDGVFMVKGTGLVISGTLITGKVHIGKEYLLGPDTSGKMKQVIVKSIHYKRFPVEEIAASASCCFQIKASNTKLPVKREDIRKGMVIVDKNSNIKPVFEFEAEVLILHHATLIKPKYQSVVHCGVVRQTAQVVEIKNQEFLRTGDKAIVRFRFIKSPEFLHLNSSILFREGRTRGVGHVTNLIY